MEPLQTSDDPEPMRIAIKLRVRVEMTLERITVELTELHPLFQQYRLPFREPCLDGVLSHMTERWIANVVK